MNKWFPDVHSVVRRGNPNWFNSAWLGLSMPLLHLPQMVSHMILLPLLVFFWVMVKNTAHLTFAVVMTIIGGLLGILSVQETRVSSDNADA